MPVEDQYMLAIDSTKYVDNYTKMIPSQPRTENLLKDLFKNLKVSMEGVGYGMTMI